MWPVILHPAHLPGVLLKRTDTKPESGLSQAAAAGDAKQQKFHGHHPFHRLRVETTRRPGFRQHALLPNRRARNVGILPRVV